MARARGGTNVKPIETPHLNFEAELWQAGYLAVAGIDEAGRGALAGPVVAAAVVVPRGVAVAYPSDESIWSRVRDSKLLRPAVRSNLDQEIRAAAVAVGVGVVEAKEIDAIGIAPATRLAMLQAVDQLAGRVDFLLIDWVRLRQCPLPQRSFAKADRISASVAAASIVAKVARDSRMIELDAVYPGYGFAAHKGYGVRAHLQALANVGPCPVHRHTFAPIAQRASLFGADDCATDRRERVADGKRAGNLRGPEDRVP